MKQRTVSTLLVIFFVIGLIVVGSPFFVVNEYNQAIITMFGKPIGDPVKKAGLYLKMPFFHKISYFERRILKWDGYPTQIPTSDKKYIWVDTAARWRIADPLKFYQTVIDERGARGRLDDIIDSTVRDLVTKRLLIEAVRSTNRVLEAPESSDIDKEFVQESAFERIATGREELRQNIYESAKREMPKYGIELIDVQIKRVNYVNEVRGKVYERMVSERNRAAEQLRSEGQGKKAEIEGHTDKELKSILSDAYRQAEIIKGAADKQATDIYAAAYDSDPEFFSFMRTLDSYLESAGKDTTVILSTDSEYFSLFKKTQ